MKTVKITYKGSQKNSTEYKNVADVEFHTYGFVELKFANGSIEEFNTDEIFSIKY